MTNFKTQDTALAGYLLARNFEPVDVEVDQWVSFLFDDTESLRAAITAYTMNEPVSIPVQDVIAGYRRALNIVRDGRRQHFSTRGERNNARSYANR